MGVRTSSEVVSVGSHQLVQLLLDGFLLNLAQHHYLVHALTLVSALY